jgi:hypothetical protein
MSCANASFCWSFCFIVYEGEGSFSEVGKCEPLSLLFSLRVSESSQSCTISALISIALVVLYLPNTWLLQHHKLKLHNQTLFATFNYWNSVRPLSAFTRVKFSRTNSPAMILSSPSQSDDVATSPSTRCITVAVSSSSSASTNAECQQLTTIALTRSTVDESSHPLQRWLDQDRPQEPWSAIGLHGNLQESSFVIRPDNIALVVEEVKLRARL